MNQLDLRILASDGIPNDTYSSTTVPDLLLAQQGYNIFQFLPTPAQGAVADWNADILIISLENLASAIATQINTAAPTQQAAPTDGALTQARQDSITLSQLVEICQDAVCYYTENGVAMIEYVPKGQSVPAAESNPGYQDLLKLISFLEGGRNAQLLLANTSGNSGTGRLACKTCCFS